jgi:hypothetical protein
MQPYSKLCTSPAIPVSQLHPMHSSQLTTAHPSSPTAAAPHLETLSGVPSLARPAAVVPACYRLPHTDAPAPALPGKLLAHPMLLRLLTTTHLPSRSVVAGAPQPSHPLLHSAIPAPPMRLRCSRAPPTLRSSLAIPRRPPHPMLLHQLTPVHPASFTAATHCPTTSRRASTVHTPVCHYCTPAAVAPVSRRTPHTPAWSYQAGSTQKGEF